MDMVSVFMTRNYLLQPVDVVGPLCLMSWSQLLALHLQKKLVEKHLLESLINISTPEAPVTLAQNMEILVFQEQVSPNGALVFFKIF